MWLIVLDCFTLGSADWDDKASGFAHIKMGWVPGNLLGGGLLWKVGGVTGGQNACDN